VVPHLYPADLPLPRERSKQPYSPAEIGGYLALAGAQPTVERRMRAAGLICLGAGAGLIRGDLRDARGTDVTIVNVALPRIQFGLGLDNDALLWVVTAYALSLAVFIPVGGALGDRFGHRPVFLTGVSVFVIGSAACALAPTGLTLIIARVPLSGADAVLA
jgi:MFS family permease